MENQCSSKNAWQLESVVGAYFRPYCLREPTEEDGQAHELESQDVGERTEVELLHTFTYPLPMSS